MKEIKHIIKDKNGLHARPAGALATVARSFESDIKVTLRNKVADGKRLLSLMSLGAKQGEELYFQITGRDEEEARVAILDHLTSVLDKG